jgi:hypothetical protein
MTPETLLPYIDSNHEKELPFIRELSEPPHSTSILNPERELRPDEVAFADGVRFSIEGFSGPSFDTVFRDFRDFSRVCMEIDDIDEGNFAFAFRRDENFKDDESFSLSVGEESCVVSAGGVDGLRRALIHIEDEMSIRRFPALMKGDVERHPVVRLRMSRSPFASYRFGTGWELDKNADAYPEEYLNRMAHCGVNGVWVAGILRELVHSNTLPEMTVPETRLSLLRGLVEKADLYGIKVYFFCIEPRIQDDRDPVFQAHPEIRGSKWGNYGRTLCTSHPLVLEYIEEVTAELFRSVPGLGGMINLFRGERTTACCSQPPQILGSDPKNPEKGRPAGYVVPCPLCSKRKMEDIYGDELNAFNKGMRSVSADAELIAWNYGHGQMDLNKKILERIDQDIRFLDTFEHDGEKIIHGETRIIDEYAISYVGPSSPFEELNSHAVGNGKSLYAKIQLGATFETPSMPYVPVPASVYRKFKRMRELGVEGVMQSWIIGGFPSIMHKAAGMAAFLPLEEENAFLERLAAIDWGEDNASVVAEAWSFFHNAYDLYPFSSPVFYFGPIAKSPAYHLNLEPRGDIAKPYNWGVGRDRSLQPYEDRIGRWLGVFSADEIIKSFRSMASVWSMGLEMLRPVAATFARNAPPMRQLAVAEALRIQFASCANVYEFYKLRDELPEMTRNDKLKAYKRMEIVALDDIDLAEKMKSFIRIEPSIGFQAEMRYYSFSEKLIDAKIAQVNVMLEKLRGLMAK